MDRHEILYRRSRSPKDASSWFCWSSDFPLAPLWGWHLCFLKKHPNNCLSLFQVLCHIYCLFYWYHFSALIVSLYWKTDWFYLDIVFQYSGLAGSWTTVWLFVICHCDQTSFSSGYWLSYLIHPVVLRNITQNHKIQPLEEKSGDHQSQ